ncbi:MAG: hypothetical protein WA154_11510 [Moraxellaceae bacterium]
MTEEATSPSVDLTADRLYPLGWGLIFRCACAPTSWSPERVGDEMTAMDPPGTSANRWVVSEPSERGDEYDNVNQLPCPDEPGRTHWLLNC